MDNDSKKRPKDKESKQQTKRYADTSTGNSTQKTQSITNEIEKGKIRTRKILKTNK